MMTISPLRMSEAECSASLSIAPECAISAAASLKAVSTPLPAMPMSDTRVAVFCSSSAACSLVMSLPPPP